jgi:hypothetical protein
MDFELADLPENGTQRRKWQLNSFITHNKIVSSLLDKDGEIGDGYDLCMRVVNLMHRVSESDPKHDWKDTFLDKFKSIDNQLAMSQSSTANELTNFSVHT